MGQSLIVGPGATAPRAAPGREARPRPVLSLRLIILVAPLVAAATAAALADWDAPEFGRHPDESAHFITGALVHDWAAAGLPWPAVDYALRYYARYPKVAMGHWPPFFYGLQGAWYGLFGVSRWAATLLTASLSAGFLTLLFECVRRRTSAAAAALAVALVAASPVFRYANSVFMADLLVAALSLAALCCYAVYLGRGGLGPALGFGGLSALAILTKQDSVVLAAVPPFSVLALRRWGLLKDWRFYAPAAVVFALCLPYYWVALGMTNSPWEGLARRSPWDKAAFLVGGLTLRGKPGLALSAFGAAAAALAARRSARSAELFAVLAAHAAGVAAVQMATPVSLDTRYRTALLPLSAFLAANAFQAVLGRGDGGAKAWRLAGLAAAAGLLVAAQPADAARKVSGYRRAVGSLPGRPGLQVVLVCSDPQGDGAVTAEFRLRHPAGRFLVVRADKVLASSTWMNQRYRLLHETPEAVGRYLEGQPVHHVLVDGWGAESGAHHGLLQSLLVSRPDRFPPEGEFPIERVQDGRLHRGTARLYRVKANDAAYPSEVRLHIPGLPRGGLIRAGEGDL